MRDIEGEIATALWYGGQLAHKGMVLDEEHRILPHGTFHGLDVKGSWRFRMSHSAPKGRGVHDRAFALRLGDYG